MFCSQIGILQGPDLLVWYTFYRCHRPPCLLLAHNPERPIWMTRVVVPQVTEQYIFSCKSGKQHLNVDSAFRCPFFIYIWASKLRRNSRQTLLLNVIIRYLKRPSSGISRLDKRRAAIFLLKGATLFFKKCDPAGGPWLLVVPKHPKRDVTMSPLDISDF